MSETKHKLLSKTNGRVLSFKDTPHPHTDSKDKLLLHAYLLIRDDATNHIKILGNLLYMYVINDTHTYTSKI